MHATDTWASVPAGLAVAAAGPLDGVALAALQRERLAALLTHAQACSPWYRQHLRGVDPARTPLHTLPVLHKATMMRHFAELITDPEVTLPALRDFVADPRLIGEPFLGRHAVWESSGSSGDPGLFVHDADALAIYDALELQRPAPLRPLHRLWDPFWLGERVAFVGAIDGHFASQAALQRLRRRLPWAADRWRSFSILQPLTDLLRHLEAFAPTILSTYPTAASMLAEASAEGNVRLALQEVWTGGETLGDAQRARIVTALACPLRHSYGASEFLPIAAECRHEALHVNADWVILEPVDAHGHAVPPGTLSHDTLLTNLANRVQPLIRYALGDRVRLQAGRCACGSALPVIEVEGRCDDLLELPGTDGKPVRLLPLAISTVLEEEADLFHFRLVQAGPATLRLHLSGPRSAQADLAIKLLRRFAASQGAAPLRLQLRCGQPLPRGRSGKLQRIVGLPRGRAPVQAPKRASR